MLLQYSSWDHHFGMSNEALHALESCADIVQKAFWPSLEYTIQAPRRRATPKIIVGDKDYRDRCVLYELFVKDN